MALIDDLLPNSVSVLEAISEEELVARLTPYFPTTRPELAKEHAAKVPVKVPKQKTFEEMQKEAKIKKAKEMALAMGIKL